MRKSFLLTAVCLLGITSSYAQADSLMDMLDKTAPPS